MDFTRGPPAREKCLRLGRKLGWLNVALADKIKALQKEIRLTEANGISKSSKVDLSLTGEREEFAVDANEAPTSYDTVDCSDDIYVDDIGSDDGVDNGGKIYDSVIVLDDDEDVGSNDNSNNNYNNGVDNDSNTDDNDESFDNSAAEVNIVIKCDDDDEDFCSNDNSNNSVNNYNNGVDDDANTDDNDESFDDSAAEIRSNFSNDDNGVDGDGNIEDIDDAIDKSDNVNGNGNVGSSCDDNGDDGVDIDADDNAVIIGDDDNSINDYSDGVVSHGSDDENIDIDKVDITDEADDHDSYVESDDSDDSDDTSDTHFTCDGDGHADVNENDNADGLDFDAGSDVNNDNIEVSNKDEGDGCGIHVFDDCDDALGDIAANYGVKYNVTRGIDDHDDKDAGIEGGGKINDSKNDATDEDGHKRDNEQENDIISGGIHDCSSYVDDNDSHDGCDSRRNHIDVCGTDFIANSLEMIEEIPTAYCEMQLDILNDAVAARVSEDEGETHQSKSYPVDDGKIALSMDRHSEKACNVEARNNLSNGEKTEDTCSTEITGVPQFVGSYYPSHVENFDVENDCQDGHNHTTVTFQGDINSKADRDDRDDDNRDMKYNGIEDEKDVVKLADSSDLEMDDNSESVVMSRPTSCMTDCSNNGDDCISDSPVKPSLSARLFKKYNPEKSESDADDFELFLQKVRTPKKLLSLSGEERQTETKSLGEFIVDDDGEELEEDVFVDPGFTPEEYDSDLENEGCYELATPVASYTSFKTPLTNFPSRTPKSTKSKCYTAPSLRPKSVLDDLLTSYASEKDFKKNRDPLTKDLFELYNRTVFENQLPPDFQITWNKRMRTTAGFCYYSRKNGVRMSRIELADKVIDSVDRLRDTLIHEMCHAASWIISGVKAGHGPVWKRWAMRSNFVHQDLPPISRCHSYSINTKYTYRCTKCQNTFGRHSKSVNLEKSRCAYCKSRIELVPQLKKDGTPQIRTPSRFALFVKENFARIKNGNEHVSHQEIMKALSSEFAKLNT